MIRKQKDNFARSIALLSLLVALSSVIVPYVQQEKLFDKQQQENMNIILDPKVNGPMILTDKKIGELGFVVQTPWHLTISNTGNRQLSIISKRVTSGKKPGLQFYTGIDGGIVTDDFSPMKLPIKLEVGESLSFYIYVGIMVPKKAYEILKSLNDGQPVLARNTIKALGEKGMDIYGNKVEFHSYGDDMFSIAFEEPKNAPKYWVALGTGAGNVFFVSASKYDLIH